MEQLTVDTLYVDKRETLALEILTPDVRLDRPIEGPTLSSPGLILAGFDQRMPKGRLQVLGETELSYIRSLDAGALEDVFARLFAIRMPAVIVTKGLEVPDRLLAEAVERDVPVLRMALPDQFVELG